MPSKSWAQHKLMTAVEHSPSFARKVGISQSVGSDFAKADNAAGITKNPDRRLKVHRDAVKHGKRAPISHSEFERLGRHS